jgi:hypothetical protein
MQLLLFFFVFRTLSLAKIVVVLMESSQQSKFGNTFWLNIGILSNEQRVFVTHASTRHGSVSWSENQMS